MSTKSTPARKNELPVDYVETLQRMATAVRSANIRATRKINAELINLYWSIGNIILEHQSIEGWGSKVIARPSMDLQGEFPNMSGLSPRNLQYMQQFASEFPTAIAQQPVAQSPWGHCRPGFKTLCRRRRTSHHSRRKQSKRRVTFQLIRNDAT